MDKQTPKWSIICCLYNSLPLVKAAVGSILRYWQSGTELILVDNHGPDKDKIAEWLAHNVLRGIEDVAIVDPGHNIGCHEGWNRGFQLSRGDYVLKFDDDTVVTQFGWLSKMSAALRQVPECGYVSANLQESAKQANQYENKTINGHEFEIPKEGIVGFSCVMFRRRDVLQWGPMKVGNYRFAASDRNAKDFHENHDCLYGGEEVYYAESCKADGMFYAHFPAVKVIHFGHEDRHPDYQMWKRTYGFYGWHRLAMHAWIISPHYIRNYEKALVLEIKAGAPNEVLIKEWVERLGDIGDKESLEPIHSVRLVSKNGVVLESVEAALEKIRKRIGS